MVAGQGGKLRDGHVLYAYNPADADASYGFYVLSVSTDTVTAVNGYEGAAIANSASMPALLEHQSPISPAKIHNAIDDIIDGYLWPQIYDVEADSFTANLTTFQSAGDARDEKVLRAWQVIGSTLYQVGVNVSHDVDTSLFATGVMLSYDVVVPGTIYYSATRKVSLANSTNTQLEQLIAKGAAALVIEGAAPSTEWETSKNDARERRDTNSPQKLWQSFYTAKREFASQLAQQNISEFRYDRG
jgi:hypothetical protein